MAYCKALTERERSAGRLGTNGVYRLPTEAEWEYACRARTSTRFSYGDDPGYTNLTKYAWYEDNSGGETHPVGQKLPNPWGLYDMHGNVWEWCQDWWLERLPGGSPLDPQGPAAGSARVVRGGCWGLWIGVNSYCRSASRIYFFPNSGDSRVGFRVLLVHGLGASPNCDRLFGAVRHLTVNDIGSRASNERNPGPGPGGTPRTLAPIEPACR